MDAKIQELTEKIYNEGVERGQTEAQRLIAEAETKAKTIEADAQARAAALIADAERRAKELKENTQSELRLYSAQLVDSLRSSIADQIQGQVAEQNTKALAVDPQFIQGLVARIVEGFDLNRGVEIATARHCVATSRPTPSSSSSKGSASALSRVSPQTSRSSLRMAASRSSSERLSSPSSSRASYVLS